MNFEALQFEASLFFKVKERNLFCPILFTKKQSSNQFIMSNYYFNKNFN